MIQNPVRAWRVVQENGFIPLLANCLDFSIKVENKRSPIEKKISGIDKDYFVIMTTKHCQFVAELIADKLDKIGIASEIIFEKPKAGFSNKLHIVICPQMFSSLPPVYIAYQMEQSVSSRWFNARYFRLLNNSLAVLDYSIKNIIFLEENGFQYKKLFYLPVFSNRITRMVQAYEYDVIFYGDVQIPRRKETLQRLAAKFKLKIINNLFGNDLYDEIAKARIVLNLHYYEDALLESTRIFEALSLGKFVISETSSDMEEYKHLVDIVEFVPEGDYSALETKILEWTGCSDEDFERELSVRQKKLTENFDIFGFYFYRMLLNFDFISFEQFYAVIGQKVNLPGQLICLSLKETIKRQRYFEDSDKLGCFIFPGLRHYVGWVGCGLSYKFLLMRAKSQGFSQVLICEDDVVFGEDFLERFSRLKDYLSSCDKWDIFCGLIADLHEETKILKMFTENGERFVHIDNMVSMVFNIYNATALDCIAGWDYSNRNSEDNTIDRYIQRNVKVDVVTLYPFLVGHKEDQISTLWNFKNSTYTNMIENSQKKLLELIKEFKNGENMNPQH